MTKKEILGTLRLEVRWCESHFDLAKGSDWAKGYIKGLRQAIRIVRLMPGKEG